MGQEYSGQNISSVSYPEAVGYLRKKRGKKNKYPLSKVEIASFSKIPYSKYIPLDERNSSSYKRSLQSHSPTRQAKGRGISSAPVGGNGRPGNPGKFTPNLAVPSRGKHTASHQVTKSATKSNGVHNASVLSTSSVGTTSLNTSVQSSKKSGQSTNTSLLSVKEAKKKGKTSSKEKKSKFVPRSDKEIQLSKIYIKPQDLVIEKPKKKKKGAKSEGKKEKKSNKQKALFIIKKKTRVEPTPVYLESPFKRQTTIRIKKSQVRPNVTRNPNSVQNARTVSRESCVDSSIGSAKTVSRRSRSPVKENVTRPAHRSRSPEKPSHLELDVVGTKAQLFVRELSSKPNTPEPEPLFTKRTRSQSPEKPKIDRPRTVSEIRQTVSPSKARSERPQSSPYHVSPYATGGTIFPGYKGKETINSKTAMINSAKKKPKRSAVGPMGQKQSTKGKIKIVKGNKSDPKGSKEPKVRLKWFNVLHRSHYQNRIDSIYNDKQENKDYITDIEPSKEQLEEDNEWKTECDSLNTYSDSFLTNTTLSTANATVVGELDRNPREVDYEPSIVSEVTIVNSETSTLVNEYEGDGETDIDKPLRFKHKKSPEILRKDLLKMQEIYFRNHPGVEEETDTDTDWSTITEEYPSAGHVDKMRRLFGVISDTQPQKASQTSATIGSSVKRAPQRNTEEPYQPSFINMKNPVHLFQVQDKENKENVVLQSSSVKPGKNIRLVDSKRATEAKVGKDKPKITSKPQTKQFTTPTFSTKTPVVAHNKKGKAPIFLTQPNVTTKITTKDATHGTNAKGRSTLYCANEKKKELPIFLQAKSENNKTLGTEKKQVKAETKKSIIDIIAKEETEDLLQLQVNKSDTDDSLEELDDAAAMAEKQQQNVRRVEVQEVTYTGDINASLAALWDKQHGGDGQRPNESTPKSPKLSKVNVNGADETGDVRMSPGRHDMRNTSEQTVFLRPLNPVHTYRKNVTPTMQSYSVADNHDNTEVTRSSNFTAMKDFFEGKDSQLTNGTNDKSHGDAPVQPLVNSMEMTSQSSEKTVTIEGNYDSYARHSKFSTNKTDTNMLTNETGGDKEVIRLPRIVNKNTLGIYSRHGPVPSTGLPAKVKQKQGVMGLYNGPTPAVNNAKPSRYSAYTWQKWS